MTGICVKRFAGESRATLNVILDKGVSGTKGALTVHTEGHLQCLVWGDPACCGEDARVIAGLLRGESPVVWGRSWVRVNNQTTVIDAGVDKLGIFPVLVGQYQNTIMLASHRSAFIDMQNERPCIASQGILQMLAFGQLLGNASILEGVRQPRGGSHIVVDGDGNVSLTEPGPYILGEGETSTFDSALESFVAAIRQCVTHCELPLVSISGGLDSRLILAAFLQAGIKPELLCYGAPGSADMKISREIAEKFGLRLHAGELVATYDHKTTERIAWAGGGEVPFHHGHSVMNPALLAATRGMSLITGTGAESYRAFYYDRGMPGYSLLGMKSISPYLQSRAFTYVKQEFGKLLNPFVSVFPRFADALRSRLDVALEPYAQASTDCAHRLDSIYLGERVRRMVVAGQQLLEPFYVRSHPFLSREVVETVSALPVSYKLSSRFHREAIAALSPSLSRITWDKTERPLVDGLRWHERYPGLASRVGMNGAWGKSGVPLANYAKVLQDGPTSVVLRVLEAGGLEPDEALKGLVRLQELPVNTHVRGVAASVMALSNLLNPSARVAA